jgi:hypothetical protein
MIRITTLLWVALLVVAGGTVMHVSYQVRRIEQHRAQTERDMRQEEDAIRLLSAEWDKQNDPRRIDDLNKRHLALEHTPIQRVVTLDALPLKSVGGQSANVTLASAAKPEKGRPAPGAPSASKPQIMVRAAHPEARTVPVRIAAEPPAPVLRQDSPDGVGLILARLERRE